MRKLEVVVGLFLVVLMGGFVLHKYWNIRVLSARQAMIHERGGMVMPFNLDQTVHEFSVNDDGGVMRVKARESGDMEQISLIREHLMEEAKNFSEADFSDPKNLHGEDMAGLSVLSDSSKKIEVSYQEVEDGAELLFATDDPEVIDAIHMWFMTQVMDHGDDAVEI